MDPLLIVALIAAFLALAALAWRAEQKRRQELARFARDEGWDYSPGRRPGPSLPFGIFERGRRRYSRFHMEGIFPEVTAGLDAASVRLFEHHYSQTSGTGKNRRTHHYFHTCALVSPGLDLGSVEIRPEGFGDKIVQAIGFDDIDFEDHEFSRRFVVKARDRRFAYDLCDARMMAFLLKHREWTIQSAGRMLVVYRRGRARAERCRRLAAFVLGFLAELPRHIVNAERERRGLPPLVRAGNAALGPEERRDEP